jgi:hypothetical protein
MFQRNMLQSFGFNFVRVSNWLSYIGGLQRKQSIRATEKSEEMESGP